MKRKILIFLTVIFALICALGTLVACKNEEEKPTSGSEVGEYYYDAEDVEYLITLSEGCEFTFALSGDAKSGTYKLDDTALTMTFKDEKEEALSATLADNVLTFTYQGVNYRFLKKITYTVKFVVEGNTHAEVSVVNGRTISRPADPTKDKSVFVGWYTDKGSQYRFGEPVTGNLTLNARFEEAIPNPIEFTVNFDLGYEGGEAIEPIQTIGGRVFGLTTPTRTGHTFVGWWVSHYEDASKLTYQYTNQILEENTTLFAVWASDAPAVSVSASNISWTASSGVANSYTVAIKTADGQEVDKTTTGTNSYNFDFSAQPAGEYTVEVTLRGNTTIAYYKNKALARVSVFKVENSVLIFNPIEHAEKYLISIVCGNPDHDHSTFIDNGNKTSYDFATCDMRKGGIEFVITAQGSGYLDSESAMFAFDQTLDVVSNLKVDAATETVSWDAVENATEYIVVVNGELVKEKITTTSYSLKSFAPGNITVEITPVARGWNSPEAATTTYTKTTLATPKNVRVEGIQIVWEAVDGATSYEININGDVKTTNDNFFPIPEEGSENGFTVSIRANASDPANNSIWSDDFTITAGEVGKLTYQAGVISWDPVYGAIKYAVKVNDGTEIIVETTSAEITFSKAGENMIYVCAILNASDDRSDWASIEVYVYKITFDAQGGNEVATLYKASGDSVELPTPIKTGYEFEGWFTAPGGAAGEGVRVTDGSFIYDNDVTLYAAWNSECYELELDIGVYGLEQVEGFVYYQQSYKLPVPESKDPTRVFAGWFAEPNGQNTQFTNHEGQSLRVWGQLGARTLYAHWVQIYTITEYSNGLSISKGPGIGYVMEVRVPVSIMLEDGRDVPVATIDDFSSCTTIREFYIPDTIQLIELAAASAAFGSCSNLRGVYIYETEGNHDRLYESTDDGVLLYNNRKTGLKELAFIPQTKSGELNIPDGVQVIPELVFQQVRNITGVEIPASVVTIAMQAFSPATYVQSAIKTITFLSDDSENEQPLEIASRAFENCTSLTSITFPARLTAINTDVFNGCAALAEINVDGTGGTYTSKDGFLCIAVSGGLEIFYAPLGKSGTLQLPTEVVSIGDNAFNGNKNLTKIVIPGKVTNIGKNAFKSNTELAEIVFEGDEKDYNLTIGSSAFYGCTSLTKLTLPENLYSLGKNAFGGCSKLTEVWVKSGGEDRPELDFSEGAFAATSSNTTYVTVVRLSAKTPLFDVAAVFGPKLAEVIVDEGNPSYTAKDGVLFDAMMTSIIYYPIAKEGEYVIPNSVTTIGMRVFQDRLGLTKITIPNTVTSIGSAAFQGCKALTEVIFAPNGTEPLVFEDGEAKATSTGGASIVASIFMNTAITSIVLPERTTYIGIATFAGCTQLKSIVIPEGVKEIRDYAFYQAALTSITLPSSLVLLGSGEFGIFNVFSNCNSLAEIKVGEKSENYYVADAVLYGMENGVATDLIFAPRNSSGTNGVVTVPASVERVWGNAFYYNVNIKTINFPAEMKGELSVSANTFYYCVALKEVRFPKGLTAVGENTFYYCRSLETVYIPSTVASLEKNAFYYCTSLTTVEFDTSSTETELRLENGAGSGSSTSAGVFYGCSALKEISLPERTIYIGLGAFARCTSLTTINIPASVTTIVDYAFYGLPIKNVYFADESKLTELGAYVFSNSSISNITLPNGLKTIGTSAFSHTENLTKIDFPEGLQVIGTSAFYYSGLTSVVIPASVEQLGGTYSNTIDNVFAYTPITSVRFADNSLVTTLYGYSFQSCLNLTNVDFGLNSRLKTMSSGEFTKCSSLKTITIPASVETMGHNVFTGCTALESINFAPGSNLKSIGNSAFQKSGLTSFSFPESTADSISIGTKLFAGCAKLTHVHLSSGIVKIDNVFSGCASIQVITVAEGNKNFKADEKLPILYNADGTAIRLVYGATEGDVLTIPDGVTQIGAGAFRNRTDIKAVIIPKSVTTIAENAFQNCIHLQTVTFQKESELTSISYGAFADCYELKDINLNDCKNLTTFTTISNTMDFGVFSYCYSLESIDLSGTKLTGLPQGTFFKCYALKEVSLPSTITFMRRGVFGYTALTSVDFSKLTKLEYIGGQYNNTVTSASAASSAFAYCGELTTVKLPANLKRIGSSTFANCPKLQSVSFGDEQNKSQLTTLGGNCFQNCTSLTSVNFNGCDTLTTLIGNYVFDGCTSLTSITLPTSLTFLGTYTFRNSGLTSIDLSGLTGLQAIANAAGTAALNNAAYTFAGCANLRTVTLPTPTTNAGIKIGSYTFADCVSLKEINLEVVGFIGTYGFKNTGLEKVFISKMLNGSGVLGNNSFIDSLQLKEIEWEDGAKYIGQNQFNGCTALQKIKIPASITTYGSDAFKGCTALATVEYEEGYSCNTLGVNTFYNCSALTGITIPASVTTLGNNLFNGTGITEIEIPAKITSLGTYLFANCKDLTKVTFEEGFKLATLGNYTFDGCSSLTSIELPASFTHLGTYTFRNSGLKSIDLSKTGLTRLGTGATANVTATTSSYIFYGCADLEEVILPKNMVAIGGYAFYGCVSLMSIDLTGIETIATSAFEHSGLTSLNIPSTLTTIGAGAFANLENLNWVTASSDNNSFYAEQGILYNAAGSVVLCPAGYEVEGGVLTLDDATGIENRAFTGVTLEKVSIANVENLGTYAFYQSNISEIELSVNLKTIGSYAFAYSAFKSLVIPEGVTDVNNNAFAFSELEEIEIKTVSVGWWNANRTTYYTATNLFEGCANLRSVILPEGLDAIGTKTFANTTSLTEIKLPSTITKIDSNAFLNSGIKSIVLPASVTSIGSSAFMNTLNLESFVIEDGEAVLAITAGTATTGVFVGSNVKSVVIPSRVTTLPNYLFYNCANLSEVTLAEGITTIGTYVFSGCTALKGIKLPETLLKIDSYAFANSGLVSIVIPNSIENSTSTANFGTSGGIFQNCVDLVDVKLSENIVTLPQNLFAGCTSLTSVKIPASVSQINSGVFNGCSLMKEIYIPATVVAVSGSPFSGLTADQTVYFEASEAEIFAWWASDYYNTWYDECNAKIVFDYVAKA